MLTLPEPSAPHQPTNLQSVSHELPHFLLQSFKVTPKQVNELAASTRGSDDDDCAPSEWHWGSSTSIPSLDCFLKGLHESGP